MPHFILHQQFRSNAASKGHPQINLRTLLTLTLVVLGLHLLALTQIASAASVSSARQVIQKQRQKPVTKLTPVKKTKKQPSASKADQYDFPLDTAKWQDVWSFFVPKNSPELKPEEGLDLLVEKDFSRVEWNADQGKFPGFLRVKIPKGGTSNFVSHFYEKPRAGVVSAAQGAIIPNDELSLTYYVRFPKGFDFSQWGWLPGLGGGYMTGANGSASASMFNVLFFWDKDGHIGVGGRYREEIPGSRISPASFEADDQWHRLDISIRLNTFPSRRLNGEITARYDGEVVFSRDSIHFRTRDQDKLDTLSLVVSLGGLSPTISAPKDTYVDLAGFTVNKGRLQ